VAGAGGKSTKRRLVTTHDPTTTTTSTTTTTAAPDEYGSDGYGPGEEYEYEEEPEYEDGDGDDDEDASEDDQFDDLKGDYWDVPCMNRTYDENFKSVQKINRNKSAVQVPINVYKQGMAINMTADWTESLDEQFKKNYDEDNELFWQYFCSTQGLFRRYPAAHWVSPSTGSKKGSRDFFDCRLQTWYIMAAASPKDVAILLDISGSMTGLRLEIGKKLIEFLLDTLTDNDFFNILTFSNSVQYLFPNETDYMDTFVQAGKANKLKYKKMLESYKNTSQEARLALPLVKVFNLFNQPNAVCFI
jgi:voltage-dependent calcium channel alpha-2/delta-3